MKRNQSLDLLIRDKVVEAETEVTDSGSTISVSAALPETDIEAAAPLSGDLFDALFPPSAPFTSTVEAPSGPIIETGKGRYETLIIGVVDGHRAETLFEGIKDPRGDLRSDHLAWLKVLGIAFALDGNDPNGIYGLLHCVRCEGATLERRSERLYLTRGAIDTATWGSVYRPRLEERRTRILEVLTEGWR